MNAELPGMYSHIHAMAEIAQIAIVILATSLTIYAFARRRKELFRSDLQKRQIEELAVLQKQLHNISFDFYYLPYISDLMTRNGWNFDDLKLHAFDDWQQIQRYKKNSLDIFYKFQRKNYYLMPKDIEKERIRDFVGSMKHFAPFTLNAVITRPEELREQYADSIKDLISYFDKELTKYAN